jgi:hypothetical protein
LDDTGGDNEAFERQLKIYKEFDTYSELSPSGKGVHLIGRGKVPSGRRRSFIEIYSSERYITFTGNVHNQKPIKDCQDILTQLWEQMGSKINNVTYDGNAPETAPDTEILTRALNASNGDKFDKLLNGQWNELYQSQSEADYAFIDIIAFYTQNKAQIARIFRASKLGQRDKAKRVDYVDRMILQSFDKMVPPIDFDGFKNALEEIKAKGRIAQSVEPTAHNSISTGSSPVAPTNQGVLHKGSASGFGPEGLGSIPSTPTNQGYYNGENGPGEKQNISEKTLSEQQRLLSQSQQSTNNNVSGMVSGVQENPEMRNVPGNSHSDTRFSSQRPETERNNNSQNSTGQSKQGTDFRRNQQVHGSVQQLSSQATLQSQIILPPGLIGHIAQFIYSAAPRPVPEIALAGALGLMAGICGKAYNISNSGLNQYILLLAKTGMGKEGMAAGIDKLISAVKMSVPTATEFIGPAYISSGQALVKHIHDNPCFVSILGEFGLRVQAMSGDTASAHERMLKQVLLEVYQKSGSTDIFRPSIYADKEKNTTSTIGPAFSILGESVPSSFYNALTEEMIVEGLLPRFLLIEYNGVRVELNKHAALVQPPFQLVEMVAQLAANCKQLMHNNKTINVRMDETAQRLADDFDSFTTAKINQTSNEVVLNLWNRAHLKALKLSALIAVGVNPFDPLVIQEYIVWAINMVQTDIIRLAGKFETGEVGTNTGENKQQKEILRVVQDFIKKEYSQIENYMAGGLPAQRQLMHSNRVIPYAYIHKRLIVQQAFKNDRLGATTAIKRAIQTLVENDKLREVPRHEMQQKFGSTQKAYVVSDLGIVY